MFLFMLRYALLNLGLISRRSLHPPVMHSFVQDILILDISFIEGSYETVLVHSGHAAGKGKELPRGINVGIAGQIMPYSHHLAELAVPDRIRPRCFSKAAQAVYDHSVFL